MLLFVHDKLQTDLMCGNETLKNIKQKIVLSIAIENKLQFPKYLVNISKKTKSKFNALTRVQKYMTTYIFYLDMLIFFSHIKCNFCYCLLVWIFPTNILLVEYTRYMNNIYVLPNKTTSFDFKILLKNACEMSIHPKKNAKFPMI